jgi:hypothetical protein
MRKISVAAGICTAILLPSLAGAQDTVNLVNGDTLKGEVVERH